MKKNRNIILNEVENKLKVKFNDINILDTALTHSSFINENKNINSNERLEFLGDSILQLCISELLYNKYNDEPEGFLTKKRALIVCGNSLHEVAKKWNIGKYINMSKGEEMTGGRTRISILSDCVEAIIASIYLDQGYEVAKNFIIENFNEIIQKAHSNEIILDYKTKLQETIQKFGEYNIEYTLVSFEGPPHRRKFVTEVSIDSLVKGVGEGYSKKESEQNAAKEALKGLENKDEEK
ncbi:MULTISPECIES: ribonuclease III [Clostridium]|uniref:Ribonuclease 3 n=1 Tax=Clostridium novyi (strain NT) TaxID=386415 RepID=A0Q0Z0_CLONN|nr:MULTISPECIES: ribonuclease III [Clostridium]ABK61655.1 ribonuclease III [Clostridium novyi NT]KEH88656.1 ribonuclease III [Clostridium novyi A str. NCTC 538]KEH89589.1 ribonuclease III [Clostridium novyi A str. 4540]KEH89642.1 ribonuclease III [Clostridium novyi A str. BKT29909]KEH94512.1 ribonuclease III [Clostridium botulinum C/D str. It1]